MTAKNEKEAKKESKRERLHGVVPLFRIEADAYRHGMMVTVSGVVGIAALSEDEIKLLTSRERINILGDSMDLRIYEGNTVEIRGNIKAIERGASQTRRRREHAEK